MQTYSTLRLLLSNDINQNPIIMIVKVIMMVIVIMMVKGIMMVKVRMRELGKMLVVLLELCTDIATTTQ